jgi:hypothetical protein
VRLVCEDKASWTEIVSVMSLDNVVTFLRLYDPWFAAVNKPSKE